MRAMLLASLLLTSSIACGGSGFSAETPVAPLAPRTSAYLEGKRADMLPKGIHREALRDDAELISAKDRSLCFRATVRQSEADDVSSGQWELEVNDQPAARGKEVLTVRDYSTAGVVVHVQSGSGERPVALPAAAASAFRVYERELSFCRGFVDGIPEDVELELTLKRSHARDSSEDFTWKLQATR